MAGIIALFRVASKIPMNRYFNSHLGFWYSLLIHLAIFTALFVFSTRSILNTQIYREVAEINLASPPVKKEAATIPLEKLKPVSAATQQALQVKSKAASAAVEPQKEATPPMAKPEMQAPSKDAEGLNLKTDIAKEIHEKASEAKAQAGQSEQINPIDPPKNNAVSLNDQPQPVSKLASETAESVGAWGAYGKNLSQACVKFRRYPASAVASGMRGTVFVAVRVNADGASEIVIKRSSGFKMLDNEALSMVSQASKVVAIPDILKNKARELVIPIGFDL